MMLLDVRQIAGQASVPGCASANPLLCKFSVYSNISTVTSTCLYQHPCWPNQSSARCKLTICRAKSADAQPSSDEAAAHINHPNKQQYKERRQYRRKEQDDCVLDRDGSDKGKGLTDGILELKAVQPDSAKEELHGKEVVAQPRELTDGGQKTAPRPKAGRKPSPRYLPPRLRFSSSATSAPASTGAILTSSPTCQPGCQPLLGPVHVLWDLDNKYPLVLDHAALVEDLRASLRRFGEVVEIRAYCNYQTLNHVPYLWDEAMAVGMEHPLDEQQPDELRCPLCGQRFKEPLKLEKHFKQLHEREHQKRLAHKPFARNYVKGDKFERYQTASRQVRPKQRGFNLEGILNKSGVVVVPVQMGPQKADVALERDARQLVAQAPSPDSGHPRPVLALLSDDRGFKPLIKMFKSRGWFTVVVSSGAVMDADVRVDWGRLVGEHLEREGWRRD